MNREKWTEQIKWGLTSFAVIAASTGVVFLIFNLSLVRLCLGKLLEILAPIVYGAVMAYLMAPVYNAVVRTAEKLYRKQHPGKKEPSSLARTAGTVLSVLILLLITGSLVSLVIPELVKSVTNLVNTLPGSAAAFYETAGRALADYPEARELLEQLYQELYEFFSGFMSKTLLPNVRNIVSSLSSGLWSMVTWVKNIFIGLIVMVYLLNLKGKLLGQFRKLLFAFLPERNAQAVIRELSFINKLFGGFIVGKLLDSLIIGFLTFFVVSAMRMPYSMLVSVIVGVTNVIPFFGPFIGAIPCFILIFLANPMKGLYFLIVILVIQQLDGNVIGPKILGDSTGLSSFWVLFSILLFGGLFGFVGMIIAVPSWAVIMNLIAQLTNARLRNRGLPLESEHYQELDKH